MKDSQHLPKKNKSFSKAHFFDTVIILALLDVALTVLVVFYFQRNRSLVLPETSREYLKVTSIPLSSDLKSINSSASAYVIYDNATRTVVASKNKDLRFSPASTAKVMSALIALEHYKLDDYLVVPGNIYSVEGSKMKLIPGEEVRVVDLIYGMMLPSGNDAAYTLAFYYKNGIEDFVKEMNEKAMQLRLLNTHFIDPAGLEDGNYTTGEELARLGAIAMENETFRSIVRTRYYETTNKSNTHVFYLENLNELLIYDNVLGIKTGFTNEAGGVLLTALKKGDSIFTVSVLKSQDRFADTKDLMGFILEKVNFAVPDRL